MCLSNDIRPNVPSFIMSDHQSNCGSSTIREEALKLLLYFTCRSSEYIWRESALELEPGSLDKIGSLIN